MTEIKESIIKGSIWTAIGKFSTLLIMLATNMWLARILSPVEFGQIGIIMFFIILANVLTDSGLGGALVRKKEASEDDYSTVFAANLLFSGVCYLIIFISAGYIAHFYEDLLLKNLLIFAGLVLIINAFQLTQTARLISEMKFKQKTIYDFTAVFLASIVGIIMAHNGYGVWSLIIIQLLTAVINTVMLWVFEGFYVRLYFSKKSFMELYSFGINTTGANLLNTGFENIYQLILGKYFSLSQTGFFYQAKRLQDAPGSVINMISQSVLFASLAKLQDDKLSFSKVYNKITIYFLVLLGFISSLMYTYAEPLVLLLYGEKWIGSVFYIQLLTIASFFYVQENINRNIFKVFNRTRQILYIEYAKKAIQSVSIIVGVYFISLKVLVIGFVITNVIGYFINYYYSRKIIGFNDRVELFTLLKTSLLSITITFLILYFNKTINLLKIEQLWSLPLLIVAYLYGLQLLKIMDIKYEIRNILNVYNKS